MKSPVHLFFILLLLVVSCEMDITPDKNGDETHPVSKEKINGFVQKGPYINGTSITILELNSDLTQTGKIFSSQITDNRGSFELKNVELSSQFVELKADGFYFNEINGVISSAQLTMYALSDLSDKSTLNVNILSHLEKNRIDYLVTNGSSFNDAKKQSQAEILKIFEFEKSDIPESELLDISKDGDDNAILLAISLIIHGYRTVAELSELLANISTDIREDGFLNSSGIGTSLINHARLLNTTEIRENLENRYDELSENATIPDFEKYIQYFIDHTDYEFTAEIIYPEFSNYGENILYGSKSVFKSNYDYSMAANLSVGNQLKIILSGGLWYYQVMPNGPVNWDVSEYNMSQKSQVFTTIETGKNCDLIIRFAEPDSTQNDSITIEYYENLSEMPTKTKNISIELYFPPPLLK